MFNVYSTRISLKGSTIRNKPYKSCHYKTHFSARCEWLPNVIKQTQKSLMVNCGQTVAITEVLKPGILNFQTKQLKTFKLFHVAKAEKLDVTMIFCAFHNF